MKQLPEAATANERALALEYRERFTGLVTAAIQLAYAPLQTADGVGLELVFKNGTLLDPSGGVGGYSITGASITLGAAAIAGDVFVVRYPYRI